MGGIRNSRGQAVIEYILLVVLIAVTVAVVIRNTSLTIYCFWTGFARQVASPCADCETAIAPNADVCSQSLDVSGNNGRPPAQ